VLGTTWDEIDLATATWVVPARRMKGRKEHRVPLSDRADAILAGRSRDRAPFEVGSDTMLRLLKTAHSGATLHGFRSSFRDWAAERTSYPEHIAEAALAHVTGDKVERAYKRTDLFEKRRRLMNDWAAWCARPAPRGATVTSIAGVR
jgi:integrase